MTKGKSDPNLFRPLLVVLSSIIGILDSAVLLFISGTVSTLTIPERENWAAFIFSDYKSIDIFLFFILFGFALILLKNIFEKKWQNAVIIAISQHLKQEHDCQLEKELQSTSSLKPAIETGKVWRNKWAIETLFVAIYKRFTPLGVTVLIMFLAICDLSVTYASLFLVSLFIAAYTHYSFLRKTVLPAQKYAYQAENSMQSTFLDNLLNDSLIKGLFSQELQRDAFNKSLNQWMNENATYWSKQRYLSNSQFAFQFMVFAVMMSVMIFLPHSTNGNQIVSVVALGIALTSQFSVVADTIRGFVQAKNVLDDHLSSNHEDKAPVPPSGNILRFNKYGHGGPVKQSDIDSRFQFSDWEKLLEPGKIVALSGPYGSGKSTLVNFIHSNKKDCGPSQRVVLVPQNSKFSSVSFYKTIVFDKEETEYSNIVDKEIHSKFKWIKNAGSMEFLSGGEAAIILIAKALKLDAGHIVFDETFSPLDFGTVTLIFEVIRSTLLKRGVIIVSHNVHVNKLADRNYDISTFVKKLPASSLNIAIKTS